MLAAVRTRHLGAGYHNPGDADAVREARAGFKRASLLLRPQTKPTRIPLPARVAWNLALLTSYSPPTLRRHLTAVVLQFWRMRRAGDITRLCIRDVELSSDGRTCYQVPDHKTAPREGLLARVLPPARGEAPDLPRQLLARLLADYHATHAPPTTRLFTRCSAKQASGVVTGWLRDGLARLGVVAPVGTNYASHSLKKGGATAAAAAGVGRAAFAELSGTSELTLAESYISALVVPSCYDRYFFGRLLLA